MIDRGMDNLELIKNVEAISAEELTFTMLKEVFNSLDLLSTVLTQSEVTKFSDVPYVELVAAHCPSEVVAFFDEVQMCALNVRVPSLGVTEEISPWYIWECFKSSNIGDVVIKRTDPEFMMALGDVEIPISDFKVFLKKARALVTLAIRHGLV